MSEDGRRVLILESTIFHPQGGGQPSDTGFIVFRDLHLKFIVHDVRSKDGVVFHYGEFEGVENAELEKGMKVDLQVDGSRRNLNSRLHSTGHLVDACMRNVGLGHLEPGKGYHFLDGPFVEYKGAVPQNEQQHKGEQLELEANALISRGGKVVCAWVYLCCYCSAWVTRKHALDVVRKRVYVATLPYDEAVQLCDGHLPDYIPKGSTPRIVKLGDNPGCPCGGTHVRDLSDIKGIKVPQIRTKKGLTKVFYNIDA